MREDAEAPEVVEGVGPTAAAPSRPAGGLRGGPSVRLDPPTVFACALLAMVALAVFAPGGALLPGPWRAAGFVPLAAGALLHRSAWLLFRKRGTPIRPDGVPRTLVTDGPYAWSRNPMYLAGFPILLGGALLLGPATPLLVLPVWAWVVDRRFLPAEERTLEDRFGSDYRAYRERVRRWL